MPQKKNPDSAELLRAKAPRVVADYMSLLGALHALPLAYAKDLQEDKEALFDAVDTIELCLEVAERLLSGLRFDRERMAAAATCATHLSRLGSEVVIWSSAEFGFCEAADDFASGSSLMPQKKNPDAAELLRAKAPRVTGSLTTLACVLHALPLAYSKDLQEDKEALFDAVDTIELCLEAA